MHFFLTFLLGSLKAVGGGGGGGVQAQKIIFFEFDVDL